MCGPKFCSMHHSKTIEEGIAQMAAELEERKGRAATIGNGEANGKQDQQPVGVSAS
jgi:hypothetical protein